LALGIEDPEAWLDRISYRTLAIWEAYSRIEPFGNDWQQTAAVLSMLSVQQSMIAATAGQKMTALSPIDFLPSDSLPWIKRSRQVQKTGGIRDGKLQTKYILQSFGFNA
jgi:hypothetical protein